MEIEELEQEELIEKQMSLARSMEDLSKDDFPLFLTVKRLLYMIDASTDFPFFCRDNKGDQIGMETAAEWHNEQGGVFMINNYQKNERNFDKYVAEFGVKLLDMEAALEGGDGTIEDLEGAYAGDQYDAS